MGDQYNPAYTDTTPTYLEWFKMAVALIADEGYLGELFKKCFPNGSDKAFAFLPFDAMKNILLGSKINAIKVVRSTYNCSLMEAKGLVDAATSGDEGVCTHCYGTGRQTYYVPECFKR